MFCHWGVLLTHSFANIHASFLLILMLALQSLLIRIVLLDPPKPEMYPDTPMYYILDFSFVAVI